MAHVALPCDYYMIQDPKFYASSRGYSQTSPALSLAHRAALLPSPHWVFRALGPLCTNTIFSSIPLKEMSCQDHHTPTPSFSVVFLSLILRFLNFRFFRVFFLQLPPSSFLSISLHIIFFSSE